MTVLEEHIETLGNISHLPRVNTQAAEEDWKPLTKTKSSKLVETQKTDTP